MALRAPHLFRLYAYPFVVGKRTLGRALKGIEDANLWKRGYFLQAVRTGLAQPGVEVLEA